MTESTADLLWFMLTVIFAFVTIPLILQFLIKKLDILWQEAYTPRHRKG